MLKFTSVPLLMRVSVGLLICSAANGDQPLDLNTAYRLAEAAQCSYYTAGFLKSEMSVTACLRAVKGDSELAAVTDQDVYSWSEGQDGYILVNTPSAVILALRGTLPPLPYAGADFITLQDWLNDFSAVPDSQGFHRGFRRAWQHIKANVEQGTAQAFLHAALKGKAKKKFLVTGHSKGGAMTIIAAVELSMPHGGPLPEPDGFYAFAAARPLTAEGAKPYVGQLTKLYRLEYKDDVVPLVPPGAWLRSQPQVTPLLAKVFAAVHETAYDSSGLGTLYYISKDNAMNRITDEHAILSARLATIASAYSEALAPAEVFRTLVEAKQLPLCLTVENNHTAHVEYLRLKIEGQEPPPGAFIPSSWDQYCGLETLSRAFINDALHKLSALCVGPCDYLRHH